jgi:sulfate transport system ATP-binding protein
LPGGADSPSAIRIDNVSKAFGATPILRDISLDIRAGELLALLGPSGSGKTTLLRIIAGLDTLDRGRVLFGSSDATALPVQSRGVGFVFQHYALFKHLTVADNIAYGLNARRRADRPAKKEIARRVGDLLDLIKLSGFADRFPAQLSGGQRQRVALARALAVEPRVLLLDEPFGALDAQVRKDLRRWLREIHDRTGQTTVFVTHDQEEALELADRVAVLSGGRLQQVGRAADVEDRPATAAVMRFLGDVNEVAGVASHGEVSVGGHAVATDAPGDRSGAVTLHVRPWHLEIAPSQEAHLSADVRDLLRGQGRLRIELAAGDQVIRADVPEDAAISIGDRVGLRIRRATVFPADGGD